MINLKKTQATVHLYILEYMGILKFSGGTSEFYIPEVALQHGGPV
jgi:hypothetical protein